IATRCYESIPRWSADLTPPSFLRQANAMISSLAISPPVSPASVLASCVLEALRRYVRNARRFAVGTPEQNQEPPANLRQLSAWGGDRTRTSLSGPSILRASRGTKTGRKHRGLGLITLARLGCRWVECDGG